jgi:CubicO group peptidase (beta-lactamase class C family)
MTNSSGWIKGMLLSLTALILGLLALVVAALLYIGIPQNAAGMAAKGVCSAAFVAGRPAANLLADDVLPASPVLKLISVDVDEPSHAVSATFAGWFKRTAVLLPNRGCVLDVASGVPSGNLPTAPASKNEAFNAAWPKGDLAVPTADWGTGVDATALQKVIDQAFIGAGDPLAANARGLAVVYKGRLLALKTAPGFSAQTPLHGWSMTKTVTGMLMHKLSAETGLPLGTPVVNAFPAGREPTWVADWRGDARKGIKVSDLLYMRDGLASTEDYQPWGSVPKMLWGKPDAAAFAAASPTEAAPGTRWRYLSQSANLMSAVARGRFENDKDYWAYPAKALFEPIGASTAVLETDTNGTWVGSSYLWASVGDWARLGQLMLNDGQWGAAKEIQVLPPGWLQRAKTQSTTTGEGRGYSAQSWLYGNPQEGTCKGRGIPEDTMAMGGHWGQVVAMIPSRELVIVRLGWTFDKKQFDNCTLIVDVLKALPA